MIEAGYPERVGVMAVRARLTGKLVTMRLGRLVAGHTLRVRESEPQRVGRRRITVTVHTRRRDMCTGETERAAVVVVRQPVRRGNPTLRVVALRARASPELPTVGPGRFVAGRTGIMRPPEPKCVRPGGIAMAVGTRCRDVCSGELKGPAVVVPLDPVGARPPRVLGVALLAVRTCGRTTKGAPVIVDMARHACRGRRYGIPSATGGTLEGQANALGAAGIRTVAPGAIEVAVRTSQRVARRRVIECPLELPVGELAPSIRRVAPRTVSAHLTVVWIAVTIRAAGKRQAGIADRLHIVVARVVTPGALDRPVPPSQWVVGGSVIEEISPFPASLSMTIGADATAELSAVRIVVFMTPLARRGQAQIGAVQCVVFRLDPPYRRVGHQLRGVTLAT